MTPSDEQAGTRFGSTHWTAVLAAAQTHSPAAEQALDELCRNYRHPLYAFARRKGLSHEDAEDVTQQFFAGRVVTKLVLQGVDPARGKFRTWLLNSFQNFMRNEHAKASAQKRGGDAVLLSVNAHDTHVESQLAPGCEPTPEQYYDRVWGETLLNRAMDHLRSQYAHKGEEEMFSELSKYLPGGQSAPPYTELASKLGVAEAALKMRVSRLRKELGQAVRGELKRTVASDLDIDEELAYLREVISTETRSLS
jgi:RNA polymerase sigma factor (sigma-70 family)